jgi:hypothetical protein
MGAAVAIDQQACLDLLSGATFGRVALNIAALPRIVPVRFDVHRGRIHASTQVELALGPALDGTVVALQADGYDDVTQQVWNVHVVGRVTAAYEREFVITPGIIDGEWLSF